MPLGSTEIVNLLVRNGANTTVRGKYGETARDLAKAYGKLCPLKVKTK